MKKTLTVNLEGTVFQIDEDAYILLDEYLKNLRYHFRMEEGGEEIVRDMEMRISELFTESLEGGQCVITVDNVEAVIVRMGRPEQLDDEVSDSSASQNDEHSANGEQQVHSEQGTNTDQSQHKEENWNASKATGGKTVRKLYRDVDNRVLGGVLAGMAVYFGWDRTALRFLVILLGLVPNGFGLPLLIIYFISQCIIPPARTAAQKLQMRGEAVNVENIGKTVTDGFERGSRADEEKEKRTGLQKFFDVLVQIFAILLKVFIFFLLICFIPVFFAIFVAFFAILFSGFGLFMHIPELCSRLVPHFPWSFVSETPWMGSLFLLSVLLLIGIPVVGVVRAIFQSYGNWKPMSGKVKQSLVVIWVIAFVIAFITFFLNKSLFVPCFFY